MSRLALSARIGVLAAALLLIGGYVYYRVSLPPIVIGGTKSNFHFTPVLQQPVTTPPAADGAPDTPPGL